MNPLTLYKSRSGSIMKRTKIEEILQKSSANQEVKVCGWVKSKRVSKTIAFVSLADGSCQKNLQIVFNDPNIITNEIFKDLGTGSAIEVKGTLKDSPAKGQNVELEASEFALLGSAPSNYPLQKKGHTLEFLREIGHLRSRTNTFQAMFRVRHHLAQAIHRFFSNQGFLWVHTPIITGSDCEGAGEMFEISSSEKKNFFGSKAYLTVSGQLQAEIMALSHGQVYTFGPTFRAENSNTTRHLSEFWMVEPEMAFCDLNDDIDLAEKFLQEVIKDTMSKCPEELEFFQKFYKKRTITELENIVERGFKRITYSEAIEILQKTNKKFNFPCEWGVDLQTEHERYLSEEVFKGPVVVYNYPRDIKSFYMRQNDDCKTVAAMDVLLPGVGEIMGGSQREERFEVLSKRMEELNIAKDSLWWYLDLRRQGSVKHAGFGLGFERLLMYLTGIDNIRDVTLCPRAPNTIQF
jgi:asparaginyl-tRNA synthetase